MTMAFGLGAVLLQEQPSWKQRAAVYISRSLTLTETYYSQKEKKSLAVSWPVHRLDQLLQGPTFTAEMDHLLLVSFLGRKDLKMLSPHSYIFGATAQGKCNTQESIISRKMETTCIE